MRADATMRPRCRPPDHACATLATCCRTDAANVFITLSARSLTHPEIIRPRRVAKHRKQLLHRPVFQGRAATHIGAERITEMICIRRPPGFISWMERMRDFERVLRRLAWRVEGRGRQRQAVRLSGRPSEAVEYQAVALSHSTNSPPRG